MLRTARLKNSIRILGLGAALAASQAASRAVAADVPDDVKTVVTGNTEFALELYAKLRSQSGNVLVSPYSISTALAMTYAGARGETAREMEKALRFTLPPEKLHPAFAALLAATRTASPTATQRISIANAIWVQNDLKLLPEFVSRTEKYYGAGPRAVDFASATDPSRRTINAWIEEQTHQKIKDFLKAGDVTDKTRLILTNAVYFKCDWAHRFDTQQTKDGQFRSSSGAAIKTPMMSQREDFGLAVLDELALLEMPYAGGRASMVVLLPTAADGLPRLEQRLTGENLSKWLGALSEKPVDVTLPRFTMRWQADLTAQLAGLGIRAAFGDSADFSGMTGAPGIGIAKVVHETYVDVNEEGTEAAAVTGVEMRPTAIAPEPAKFVADHPFVFLIRDTHTGSILFIGRVTNPKG